MPPQLKANNQKAVTLNVKRHNLAKSSRMYAWIIWRSRKNFQCYPSSRENWSAWVSNLTISIAKTSSKFHKILKWLRLLRRISFWKFHTWKIQAKLLQRSPVVGDFYGTGIEIWAGFELIGSTTKKGSGSIMSNFWRWFFDVFRGKRNIKIFLKTL